MAIFNPQSDATDTPEDPTSTASPNIQEHERDLKTATFNTKKLPFANLIAHVEGYRWTVDYYSQILGRDDAPQVLAISLSETLQQYHKINDYELRVQSPLTHSFEGSRQSDYLEGTAIITPNGVTPCRMDMFTADIGDGRVEMFTLMDVRPLNILNDRCYEVTYKTITSSNESFINLENKVVKKSWFSDEFLQSGQDPILDEEQVVLKKDLESIGFTLINIYGQQFIDPSVRQLVVPGQEKTTYDTAIAELWQRLIDVSQFVPFRRASWSTTPYTGEITQPTIWDMITPHTGGLDYSNPTFNLMLKKIPMLDVWNFKTTPWFGSIYYSSIYRIVLPMEDTKDATEYPLLPPYVPVEPPEASNGDTRPDIHLVNKDSYYVLTQSFYDVDYDNMSTLEYLFMQMIERKQVKPKDVLDLAGKSLQWPPLERFYYTPILVALLAYVRWRL